MVIYCRNNDPHKVSLRDDDDGYVDLEAIAQQIQLERDADEELEEPEDS
jgi:hypothetical protein